MLGLVTDSGDFGDGHSIIPAVRQILLPDLEPEFDPWWQGLLILIENPGLVVEDGLAIKVGEDHLEFGHADRPVGNILQIAGDDVDPLAGKVLAGRDAEVGELEIILNGRRVADFSHGGGSDLILS